MAQETNKTAASNQPAKKNRHLRLQLLEQDA